MRFILLIALLLLTACDSVFHVMPETPVPITLRNPWTRAVIRCPYNYYNANEHKACAYNLQSQGFERVEHTSFLPAKYDFAVEGSYPTRRWRENELVPRW